MVMQLPDLSHLPVAAQRLLRDGRARRRAQADGREAVAEAFAALLLIVACLALGLATTAGPSPLVALALAACVAIASRVEFDVGAGYTSPEQLVFVPLAFAVPPAWIPVVAAAGLLLGRLPDVARDGHVARHALVATGNAWFAVGPAVVFAVAGVGAPQWSEWPVYALALGAQFATDTTAGMLREWWVLGVAPRLQLRMMGFVWLVDALLAPIGFLAAVAAAQAPYAFLLVLPLVGVMGLFARERTARVDQAIELSASYRGTALLLGEVLSEDDAYTGEHSRGVLDLALAAADQLGVDEEERILVEFGALLHDVGKIAVPETILNKPGPLTDAEWAVMREHTVLGQRMLDRVGGTLADVGLVVRASHERWDGGGYPDRLAGEAIPLASRIVAVADAYSAITTSRPYREARSADVAIAELQACAGGQFDPRVVGAMVAVLARSAVVAKAPAPLRPLGAVTAA